MLLLAETTSPDVGLFAQYGAVGLIAAIALWASWALYRSQERSREREREHLIALLDQERAEHAAEVARVNTERLAVMQELREMSAMIQTTTLGTLAEATRAVTDAISELARLRQQQRRDRD